LIGVAMERGVGIQTSTSYSLMPPSMPESLNYRQNLKAVPLLREPVKPHQQVWNQRKV